MKGYNLSTDYSKLWDLVHDGYRIPGWILKREYEDEKIYNIVEIKQPKMSKYILIGTPGIGYETFENTKEAFIENCESLDLRYVIPAIA